MLSAKKRLWVEILLHVVFWAGVFYVLTSLNSSHIRVWGKAGAYARYMRDGYEDKPISAYVYVILVFLAALFYGNIFGVFPKVIRNKKGIVRLAICAGWFTIVFGANYFIVGPLFESGEPHAAECPPCYCAFCKRRHSIQDRYSPADPIPESSSHPSFDAINFMISDWRQIQPVILLAFLVMEGIAIAYFFLNAWAKSELVQIQLQANQLSTEIKFLKSQINPHFLFNTLNNLFSMAQDKGNDELADGISKLSGMMRYMLYDSNEESVPLSKEIIYLEECITLNKLRYADEEVKITFDHPEQIADIRSHRCCLSPLWKMPLSTALP